MKSKLSSSKSSLFKKENSQKSVTNENYTTLNLKNDRIQIKIPISSSV